MQKYTITDFKKDFPDDKACLEWLKNNRWPNDIPCWKCMEVTPHHLMEKRRSYSCQNCGNHVHPTADTIFHKSPTSLVLWFYAIYLMASTRCGISAKQVERELGVTYKTAWRMCHLIRQRLDEGGDPLSGNVEADESYFGGKAENMHKDKRQAKIKGRGTSGKTAVFGMVERQGNVKAKVVADVQKGTLTQEIVANVVPGSHISTDEFRSYSDLPEHGYSHGIVTHSMGEYVNGDDHTNTIEGFWSLVKRGIDGVYHQVSPDYLHNYLAEYGFRYNHRNDHCPMFRSFLDRVGVELDELPCPTPRKIGRV
ncbi:MAG: IS1595 family transposase [Chloroflexota bacterium]|nr:IS1595 family transposase [Chloroflexota bacterium]